jgi:hypothetical protein
MKEFNFKLDEVLFTGLRRFPYSPRRSGEPIECHNLAPAEKGLELHEYVTSMNESASFGGLGSESASAVTRTITINVVDFISVGDLINVSVYIDEVLKGITDADGLITIASVTVGSHAIKMTKTGYLDSDVDTLLNDFIMVI